MIIIEVHHCRGFIRCFSAVQRSRDLSEPRAAGRITRRIVIHDAARWYPSPRVPALSLPPSLFAMSSSRVPSSCLSLLRQQGCSGTRTALASSSAVRCFSTSPMSAQAPPPRRVKPAAYEGIDFKPPRTIIEQIERYPRHPLNAFFPTRRYEVPILEKGFKKDGTPEKTRVVEGPAAFDPEDLKSNGPRRAWKASELRRKSSVELHQLWYILLFERNRNMTSYAEVTRATSKHLAQQMLHDTILAKLKDVRDSSQRSRLLLLENVPANFFRLFSTSGQEVNDSYQSRLE